ncbi:MAG: hypothetical protein ACI914_001028 [Candidatus Marivariicella framensis]|jgi:hypothetical protein
MDNVNFTIKYNALLNQTKFNYYEVEFRQQQNRNDPF